MFTSPDFYPELKLFHSRSVFLFSQAAQRRFSQELTADGPSWKPWTEIRTVSPTLALLGLVDSLGPLGAAEGKTKDRSETFPPQTACLARKACMWRQWGGKTQNN